jgi:HAD superfamily hydrolase (TIGR01509 family)
MIEAVIFDFDGTLVDSEPNFALSDVAMVRRFGGSLTVSEHHEFIGVGAERFISAMKERFGLSASREEMRRVQEEEYLKLALTGTVVFPEMMRLLTALDKRKVPLAIASGTSGELLERLSVSTGIRRYFRVVLSSEEVKRGKPAPDVFLEAARRLGVTPERCLVLEDSIAGCEAALAAGMALIALPGQYQQDRLNRFPRGGTLLSEGMKEFESHMVLDRLAPSFQKNVAVAGHGENR